MTDSVLPSGLPSAVGVLGGGRMGAGIAHAFLISGAHVTVVEANPDAADAARGRVLDQVQASADRGKLSGSVEDATARLTVTSDVADFAGCGLVIEAVPEDMGIKTSALKGVAEVVGENAWLGTNTSSLSVDDLAAAVGEVTGHPERLCGLHFFNPVPASKLIEVVIGEATSDELRELAPQWVTALGKTPVVVKNRPGFASSRLGVAIALEAMRMVEEGVATPEDIDNAMTLGYKHPVGPLALTDIVGLDVRLGIAEYLASELGDRFAPPQILRDKVAAGELGRKSGKGFYDYN
jgi:3-hydroxybutyryl-CoA dehydrogenase